MTRFYFRLQFILWSKGSTPFLHVSFWRFLTRLTLFWNKLFIKVNSIIFLFLHFPRPFKSPTNEYTISHFWLKKNLLYTKWLRENKLPRNQLAAQAKKIHLTIPKSFFIQLIRSFTLHSDLHISSPLPRCVQRAYTKQLPFGLFLIYLFELGAFFTMICCSHSWKNVCGYGVVAVGCEKYYFSHDYKSLVFIGFSI